MADKALVAAEWLFLNRSKLDAKFHEFSWSDPWGLSLFDFEVSLMGGRHSGRGTAKTEDLAMAKAVSEAIERLVCAELNISTQGVAAHPLKVEAELNAFNESLERTLFQHHLRNEIPFLDQVPSPEVANLFVSIEKMGGAISLQKMLPAIGNESCVCVIRKNNQNFLGLGFGESSAFVQWGAIIEALRNFATYCKGPDDFVQQTKLNSDLWSCDSRFFEEHSALFLENTINSKSDLIFKSFTNSFENLNSKIELSLPVSVVKAVVTLGEVS